MYLFYIFLLGLSLSMDSFSLALVLGNNYLFKHYFLYSLLIGVFHFVMPLIGFFFGLYIRNLFNMHLITFLIFTIIWLEMIKNLTGTEENHFSFKIVSTLLIALGVSMDSFGVGLTLYNNIFLSSFIFSLVAFTSTFLGLVLSKYLKNKLGKKSLVLGIAILFLLSLVHLKEFILIYLR